MKPEIASAISQSVNHPKIVNAINDYLDWRIEKLHEQLESAEDIKAVYQFQGAIRELKKMKKLRDDALAVVEQERKR